MLSGDRRLSVMATLFGNLIYWLGVLIAGLFVAGGAAVIVAGQGESPLVASAFALALAVLSYGFGWSGRSLLQGREQGRV